MDTVFCGNTYFIVYKPECLDVLQSEFAPDVNNGPHISCMFKKSETDTCSPGFYILIIDGGRYPNTVFSLPGIQYSCEKKKTDDFIGRIARICTITKEMWQIADSKSMHTI